MSELSKRVTIKVSEDLHKRLREKALREGINLSQLLRNWLTEWVEGDEPPPKREQA
jgi:predicted HicB family RNase H-like nuclease